MLHEDYLVRQIDVMVKYLAETVFKNKKKTYNITAEKYFEINGAGKNVLYLYDLADQGKINLAENILYDKIDEERSLELFEVGVDFYVYLNSKDDDFLESNDFSRQEIYDGLEAVSYTHLTLPTIA